MTKIITLDAVAPNGPALQTTKYRDVENYQIKELSHFERNQFERYEKKYGGRIKIRVCASPIYNCHGLTFAGRRTGIYDRMALDKIIKDDSCRLIPLEDVLPGDIILYFGVDGDIEHSGIVVSIPKDDPLKIPYIVSKWGKYCEVFHLANDCDYNFSLAKYYRIQNDQC